MDQNNKSDGKDLVNKYINNIVKEVHTSLAILKGDESESQLMWFSDL